MLRGPLLQRGLFESDEQIEAVIRETPWRIQVTDTFEVVVIDRWREHLGYMWAQGIFAEEARVRTLVDGACAVAADRGFEHLLSPFLTRAGARPYERAGMKPHRRVIEMAAGPSILRRVARAGPWDPRVEEGGKDDIEGIMRVDAAAFEPFWAFDEGQVRRRVSHDRTTVVREDGAVVGFALTSVSRGVGRLHRLAVAPETRGRGVGGALLEETLGWMAESGAEAAFVNTQEENDPAIRLYRGQGFRPSPEILTMLISDRL